MKRDCTAAIMTVLDAMVGPATMMVRVAASILKRME